MKTDLRTQAIVLRRTNYGESDRILNLLTPEGKLAVLARGARKEKSRLAGGIELFSVAEIMVHQGRGSLGTLTSAKMLKFYGNILADMSRLELASECLKKIDRIAEQTDNPEYFEILQQTLNGINQKVNLEVVKAWFVLNLAQASGEEINLSTDVNGAELDPKQSYFWENSEEALRADVNGWIKSTHIKLARMLLASDLVTVARVQQVEDLTRPLEALMRAYL